MLNAAHDLRNYFTVINGRCEQATRGVKDPLWCVGEIQKLLRLCNDAVDAMYVGGLTINGTLPSRFGFDLNEVAREVASSLLVLPSENQMTVQAELKLDLLPLIITGSAWELDRAVRNLCINAAKAIALEHPTGAGLLKIKTADDAERVWLSVEDNGCGMSADQLARVMSFTEVEPSKEHGVGLWIVHNVAEKLGCKLLCESEPGKGTTFMLVWNKHNPDFARDPGTVERDSVRAADEANQMKQNAI